ncbi:hypothetical protein FF011L_33850 [Roseimaritima multifibrata]|uniref:Uncharacterized protein n=1 Tax=Roseimaritima multifibrata TaxID=1930274 RepID=A0A517MI95_9BACT|nr:hypothetical protein FF011L_33850 [Roseimaritima multifibrata]
MPTAYRTYIIESSRERITRIFTPSVRLTSGKPEAVSIEFMPQQGERNEYNIHFQRFNQHVSCSTFQTCNATKRTDTPTIF